MPTTGPQNWPENSKNWRSGFWSLIATQFQGAFNDNGRKFFVIYLILGQNPTTAQKDFGVFLIGNLFAIPFLLFSMTGGFLADRYSKRSVTIGTKLFEIAAMLFAIFAFYQGNPYLAYIVIFLASTQAALFGPSKYGLLPELLPPELLSWGNGVLELTTFVAIISGTVAGSFLAQQFQGSPATAGLIYGACSLIGLGASFLITRVPASDPGKNSGSTFLVILARSGGWCVRTARSNWQLLAILISGFLVRCCNLSSFFTAAKSCTSTKRAEAICRRRWLSALAWEVLPLAISPAEKLNTD
jgi:acyl-[acyl-carrier-protein]-phospholipid O-acyltransferase/long-chain-fatty-acid--[acyl-carrier-protein] ligase